MLPGELPAGSEGMRAEPSRRAKGSCSRGCHGSPGIAVVLGRSLPAPGADWPPVPARSLGAPLSLCCAVLFKCVSCLWPWWSPAFFSILWDNPCCSFEYLDNLMLLLTCLGLHFQLGAWFLFLLSFFSCLLKIN